MKQAYIVLLILTVIIIVIMFPKGEPNQRKVEIYKDKSDVIFNGEVNLKEQGLAYYTVDDKIVLRVSIPKENGFIEKDIVVSLIPQEVSKIQKVELDKGNTFKSDGLVLNLILFDNFNIVFNRSKLNKIEVNPVKLEEGEISKIDNNEFPFPYLVSYVNVFGEYGKDDFLRRDLIISYHNWHYDLNKIQIKDLKGINYRVLNKWRIGTNWGGASEVKDLEPFLMVEYASENNLYKQQNQNAELFNYYSESGYNLPFDVPLTLVKENKDYYLKKIVFANYTGWYDQSKVYSDGEAGTKISYDDSQSSTTLLNIYKIIQIGR